MTVQDDVERQETELIVGTYAGAGGAGLTRLSVRGDRLIVGDVWSDAVDASFALWSARHGFFYAVREQAEGGVSALAIEGGRWRLASTATTGGAAPCHLALDPAERLLAVANYESGSVAVFRLGLDGRLPETPTVLAPLAGRGPDPERQAGPHAHWVGFEPTGQRLHVVDLGSDSIWMLDVAGMLAGIVEPTLAYKAPAGTGPRHLAFDRTATCAYLVSELASTVTVLSVEADGTLEPIRIISTLPAGAKEGGAGAIVLNAAGDRLYVTNRGHDSVQVFAVTDGDLTLIEHVPSGGASPRHLLLLEQQGKLLVAHEQRGGVRLFGLDRDGRLTALDTADIPGSASAALLPA